MVDLLCRILSVKLTSKGFVNYIFKDLFFCPIGYGFYYFEIGKIVIHFGFAVILCLRGKCIITNKIHKMK